ncbi:hypothetical protein HYV11_00845 [Candidatus Dependentiae bacterium]|nr:hypothetical protein [Candidatus Dependentiae bacterium]
MFLVNEKVVYPGYGVAVINKLVNRSIAGKATFFYELKFFDKEMTVLVPEKRIEEVGIRRLSSINDLKSMFKILNQPFEQHKHEVGVNNWNRRNKKYQTDLRSGDLFKLSYIYRDLQSISQDKELSFGEKALCTKIESMLIEEISAVKNIGKKEALQCLKKSVKCAKKTALSFSDISSIKAETQTL